MVKKECPTCKKEFANLAAHLKNKKPCFETNTVIHTTEGKTALSLFSGAGGDTQGLTQAGYKVIAYNEFNEHAVKTHEHMFPDSKLIVDPKTKKQDIKKIPDEVFAQYKGKVNVVFAGFPCQGFSHAGKKKHNDQRNELVNEFARVAKLVEPEWIIGENVKGLLSRKGRDPAQPPDAPLRPVIEIIKDLFERTGYKLTYKLIDVTEIGIPQNRKRLILVGHKGNKWPHLPWDSLEPSVIPTSSSIRSFLEPHLVGALSIAPLYKPAQQPAHYWVTTTELAPTGTPHTNLDRLMRGVRNLSGKEIEAKGLKNPLTIEEKQVVEPEGLISFGVRKGGYHGMIVNPDVPCNTIISTYNLCPRLFVGLHNPQTDQYWARCMTPKELGQIQGFSADYAWQGPEQAQIAQIGNAVPPPLIERVAKSLDRVEFKDFPQSNDEDEDEDDED